MVNGAISGARPEKPATAACIGVGNLTGSFIICCCIVPAQIGCPVVSGTVTHPACAVRMKFKGIYSYVQLQNSSHDIVMYNKHVWMAKI